MAHSEFEKRPYGGRDVGGELEYLLGAFYPDVDIGDLLDTSQRGRQGGGMEDRLAQLEAGEVQKKAGAMRQEQLKREAAHG